MSKKRKDLKGVIPKRIAGVKVPKAARRGRFGELLASRSGQAAIAEAILGPAPEGAPPVAKPARKTKADAAALAWTPYGAPDPGQADDGKADRGKADGAKPAGRRKSHPPLPAGAP